MMVKGWRKTQDSKRGMKWKNNFKIENVFIVHDLNVPFGLNNGSYYFMVKDKNNILKLKKNITKKEALIIATSYMKKHPNG